VKAGRVCQLTLLRLNANCSRDQQHDSSLVTISFLSADVNEGKLGVGHRYKYSTPVWTCYVFPLIWSYSPAWTLFNPITSSHFATHPSLLRKTATMASPTGLDILRKRTIVDCDTMDEQSNFLYKRSPGFSVSV
jgi:hypothetical protein